MNIEVQSHIEIRRFSRRDADAVFDFFEGLSDQNRYFFHPYKFTREEAEFFTSEEDLTNPNIIRYMAVVQEGGREIMAGHVFFWNWTRKVPWLGISVRDMYQGIGLGKRMMEHALTEARRGNKGGILLTTAINNHRAQALYKKFGFETIGNDPKGEYLMIHNFKEDIDNS